MYTRSYYGGEEKLSVPENYDGYAFSEEMNKVQTSDNTEKQEEKNELKAPWDIQNCESEEKAEEVAAKPREHEGVFYALMEKLPFGKMLGNMNFFKNGAIDFGTEELLIIGIALFLLFSKNGDKECSLILLFLLFIK